VLGDLAEVSNLQPHAARLEEHRLEALELRIGADLELGRHGALVGELAGLCAEHPLRERLWAQRILALYRSGRQADALRAYQEVRTILTEELGIEPGRELQELELSVLGHEGQLASPLPETHPFPGVGAAEDDPALRLMLVDDHPVWRQAIKATVAHAGVARVVAEADDGDEAVRLATEVHPDVILMDLHLPGRPGTEATRAILGLNPGVRVLMLSSSDDDADVLEAIKAGASGYLLKSASAAEVTDAVLHAAAGQAVFSPAVANVVLRQARGDGGPGLDARQRQIMRLLADGMTYGRIAVQLGTTEADVRALVLAAVRTDDGQAEPTRALRTVTFLDIVGSTAIGVDLGDRRWAEVVRQYHDCTRGTVEAHGGVLVKTAGDGVMATFTNPTDAIIAAREAMDRARELDLVLRAGIHSGECEIVSDDLHGVAVNIAARVIDRASDDEILISQTVRDLALGAEIEFHDRGAHALRGVPGRWRLYAAAPA
jgi:DNA-binding NarL/FixJ family response regulator